MICFSIRYQRFQDRDGSTDHHQKHQILRIKMCESQWLTNVSCQIIWWESNPAQKCALYCHVLYEIFRSKKSEILGSSKVCNIFYGLDSVPWGVKIHCFSRGNRLDKFLLLPLWIILLHTFCEFTFYREV